MNFEDEGKGDTVQFIVGGNSMDNCTIVTFHLCTYKGELAYTW